MTVLLAFGVFVFGWVFGLVTGWALGVAQQCISGQRGERRLPLVRCEKARKDERP